MPQTQEQTLFGHPKGAFLLASIELWERFGFFGMMGLLVLFLTSAPIDAGFGWQAGDAKLLVGNFFAAMWVFPVVGSWLADRYLGAQRSILIGAVLMMIGYFTFTLPTLLPRIIGMVSGTEVYDIILQSGVMPGQIWLQTETSLALIEHSGNDEVAGIVLLAYRMMGISFYLGLLLIAVGNAFFKPCIVALVGRFYREGDTRREGGYTILYLCINLGGLLSNFIVGTSGERLGWHYGFALAGMGMLIGLGLLLYNRDKLAVESITSSTRAAQSLNARHIPFTTTERRHFRAILVLMVFTALYIATYGQLVGLVNEFVFQRTDRILLGFEIPATWFLSLNPLFIIIFGAYLSGLWQRLEAGGRNPPVLVKYFAGMTLISLSFLCLAGAAVQGEMAEDGKGHMFWIVIAYLLFTLGELFIFPIFMALITRLAPPRHSNLAAGLFFLAAGIGSYASGQIGTLSGHYGDMPVFAGIALGALLSAIIALSMVRVFGNWIQQDKHA